MCRNVVVKKINILTVHCFCIWFSSNRNKAYLLYKLQNAAGTLSVPKLYFVTNARSTLRNRQNLFTAPTLLRSEWSGYTFWQRRYLFFLRIWGPTKFVRCVLMSHFSKVKYPDVQLAKHFRLAPGIRKCGAERSKSYILYGFMACCLLQRSNKVNKEWKSQRRLTFRHRASSI